MENVQDGIQIFKILSIRSKALCLGIPEPTKRFAAQIRAYAFRNRQCKQTIVKENEKNIRVKEIGKICKIWMNFFPNVFSILGRLQLYIIAKHKASNCFKTEAVIQRFSGKKEFLKILKNLQENPCARASFLTKL